MNRTIQLLRRQVSRNLPMKLLLEMINESRKNEIVREFVFTDVISPLFLYFTETFVSAFCRTNTTPHDIKLLHRKWSWKILTQVTYTRILIVWKKKKRKMYISIYIQVSLGICVNHTMGVSVLCREKLDQQGILIFHKMWKYTVCRGTLQLSSLKSTLL